MIDSRNIAGKSGKIVMAAFLAFALFCVSAEAGQYPKMVIQIGHDGADTIENHLQYYGVQFRDIIAEKSNGAIEVQIYPSSQIGGERDLMEGMQIGTIDMAMCTGVNIGTFYHEYMLYDLPYFFASLEEGYKVMDSIGLDINQRMYENIGVKVLSNGIGGFRNIGNNVRPIRKVADLQGIKIRTPEQTLYMETFKLLGANPTPMAWAEVFTGLQQGTIDAFEAPTSVQASHRMFEVAKYFSETRHLFSPIAMMMAGTLWDSLDAETQKLFSECALEAAVRQRAYVAEIEVKQLQMMIANGTQANSDVDFKEFRSKMDPIYTMFRDKIGGKLMDAAMAKLAE